MEIAVDIPDVGNSARHAGREVASSGTQNHDSSARHVLATVIADAFDHGPGTAVAHAEPFGSSSAEESLTARGSVQHNVADQDILLRHKAGFPSAGRSRYRPPESPLPT